MSGLINTKTQPEEDGGKRERKEKNKVDEFHSERSTHPETLTAWCC